jgi:glycosyltransferase involved in cell wall biosynthesis/uncharacterized protein Usg
MRISETTPQREPNSHPVAACTIISKNYLAYARVLGKSLHEQHPEIPFHVLLVDRIDGAFDPTEEPFTVWTVEQLENIPHLLPFLFKYTILEANTAVKPYFLEKLFQTQNLQKLFYFDPDIYIFSPLDNLIAHLDTYGAVLTPHILSPISDKKKLSEANIMQAGINNLGFIGLRDTPEMQKFIRWWQERLYDQCVVDFANGLFVDQKWVDIAIPMFPGFFTITDPRYNIAYWNLHERGADLAWSTETKLQYGGTPVVFYHFSGFDAEKLEQIAKHQNRYRLSDFPTLRPLYEFYRDAVAAEGHETAWKWKYAFATFENGVKIPNLVRSLFREMGEATTRFANPFATDETGFFHYLTEEISDPNGRRGSGTLPRLWWELHRLHPDLQRAFPEPFRREREPYLHWIQKEGKRAFPDIDDLLFPQKGVVTEDDAEADKSTSATVVPVMPSVAPSSPRVATPLRKVLGAPLKVLLRSNRDLLDSLYFWSLGYSGRRTATATQQLGLSLSESVTGQAGAVLYKEWGKGLPFGLNIAGYHSGTFGVAEAGRAMIRAAKSAQIPVALNEIWVANKRLDDRTFADEYTTERPYSINLLTVNADQVTNILQEFGVDWLKNRYNIGTWYWELPNFPEEFWDAFAPFDEIWVTSSYCAEAIARVSPIPVVKMTYPFTVPTEGKANRQRFGIPEEAFAFVFSFDYHSFIERKNPMAVIQAFRQAFGDSPNQKEAVLVLKSVEGEHHPEKEMMIRECAKGLPVIFVSEHLKRSELGDLFASCDALVSLHRSEGLGLGMAEAMYLGKPVIATAYSGNMDFMDVNTALLVRYKLVELQEDYGPYKKGNYWADPDIDHAAEQMRRLVDDRAFAKQLGCTAREHIHTNHNLEASARDIKARLERIQSF